MCYCHCVNTNNSVAVNDVKLITWYTHVCFFFMQCRPPSPLPHRWCQNNSTWWSLSLIRRKTYNTWKDSWQIHLHGQWCISVLPPDLQFLQCKNGSISSLPPSALSTFRTDHIGTLFLETGWTLSTKKVLVLKTEVCVWTSYNEQAPKMTAPQWQNPLFYIRTDREKYWPDAGSYRSAQKQQNIFNIRCRAVSVNVETIWVNAMLPITERKMHQYDSSFQKPDQPSPATVTN